jgi:hypothetical protein
MRMLAASVLTVLAMSGPVALAGGAEMPQARGTAWARPGLSGPQARLMAERGAQVVASRNLLVRESGTRCYVTPPYQHLSGVVSGHQYLPATHLPDGRAVVIVQKPRWY